MIRFINRLTGTVMLVSEQRKEEYLAAGHRLIELPAEPAKPTRKTRTTKAK